MVRNKKIFFVIVALCCISLALGYTVAKQKNYDFGERKMLPSSSLPWTNDLHGIWTIQIPFKEPFTEPPVVVCNCVETGYKGTQRLWFYYGGGESSCVATDVTKTYFLATCTWNYKKDMYGNRTDIPASWARQLPPKEFTFKWIADGYVDAQSGSVLVPMGDIGVPTFPPDQNQIISQAQI